MARTMVASDQESRDIINWSEIKMYDKSELFEWRTRQTTGILIN